MKKIIPVLFIALALSTPAFAAGMSGHMLMTDLALGDIKDAELQTFLAMHHDALLCGCMYPDAGFTLRYTPRFHNKWDYGEDTHLASFIEAYQAHVAATCPGDPARCGDLAAHFLGVAAHILEDQLYDEVLYPRAVKMDFAGRRMRYDHDVAIDMLVIQEQHRWNAVPKWTTPASDLSQVYASLGLDVPVKDIMLGSRLLKLAVVAERGLVPGEYLKEKKRAPWFAANYDTAPGGMEYNGTIVARYWEALWQRLSGDDSADQLLAVYPEDGETMPADAELHAMFSRGIEDPTVSDATFLVRDADGHPVAGKVRTGRTPFGTSALVATFAPLTPLVPGASYTATLTTGIHDLIGTPLGREYSWNLTAAAPEKQ